MSDIRHYIQGNFSQSDKCFSKFSRNRQCTANSVAAIVMAADVPVSVWRSENMDDILKMGDHLYKITREQIKRSGYDNIYLDPLDIPLEFNHAAVRYELISHTSSIIGGNNREVDLTENLSRFSTSALLAC